MDKRVAIILLNYKDYANKYLKDCISGIRQQDYQGGIKLYIVDNAGDSNSFRFLKENASEAEIIVNKDNDGFAKGNNDAMKKALAEKFPFVLLLNMDTIIESNCVRKLVQEMESADKIGAVQARLMLHPEKEKVNSLGNSTHFLGFGYCLNYQDNYQELIKNNKVSQSKNIFYPSGAAVLLKSDVLNEVGLFDETYFMYNEDQDLGWRIWLQGYSCVLAKDALVYHKYEFSRSISKYYFMDRNRLITIFKNYHIVTLLLLIPAAVIMELGLLLFSAINGSLKEKFKTWAYFLKIKNWKNILQERKKIQKNRRIKEVEIFKMLSGRIWYQELASPFLRIGNFFLNIYFIILKSIIKFLNI